MKKSSSLFPIEEFIRSGTLLSLSKDRLLIGWGERLWLSAPKENKTSFYFPDFFLTDKSPWFIQEQTLEISLEELLDQLPACIDPVTFYLWENPYQKKFENAFTELQELFSSKKLLKAVPYVFERSHTSIKNSQLIRSLKQLIHAAKSHPLHLYGFWEEEPLAGILGASPELLFLYDNDLSTLQTVACAGTCPLQADMKLFIEDPKMREEHQFVIQGIEESLSQFGKVVAGKISVIAFANIAHLVTPIEVKMRIPFDFEKIVKALHPTPALGALPRSQGFQWLKSYGEMLPRGRYGAPAGYIHEGKACCFVAIRNMQWDKKGIAIGAGCGVVSKSVCNEEWKEILLKIETIKKVLGLL
jgi:menaquinone-specific isochorismate synthase